MQYTMTFMEGDYQILVQHLFQDCSIEQAAYLVCRMARTPEETRLLVRKIIPVEGEEIEEQDAISMNIRQQSFLRAIKEAAIDQACFLFVHSHPTGLLDFSSIDNMEETSLLKTAYNRIRGDVVHGSMVFTEPTRFVGRISLPDGSRIPIDLIRTIGRTFQFYFREQTHDVRTNFFDRQILAFGKEIQSLLGRLRIGVVGAGGTGSAVIEQLIRLGVGNLLIIDDDVFKSSNINRVYGSRVTDESVPKVELMKRHAEDIGLGTNIIAIQGRIYYKSVFLNLKGCDIVFGCTDDEFGRSILNRMAIYYLIPVFDMGVKIDSTANGAIKSIQGRITTLMPSVSCLFCRGRIESDRVYEESLNVFNPEEGKRLRNDGYVRGLDTDAPAVIPFTTSIASSAIVEFLHRLTGFLGPGRDTSEVLHLFDSTRIRTNNRKSLDECFCNATSVIAKGDTSLLLEMIWPEE